jgi:hypothetical protein
MSAMHIHTLHSVWILALFVLLLNVPFGFWRAGVRRFSAPWFFAVHAPVPFVAAVRIASGLGWRLATFPVLVAAFFLGQYFGGRLRHWLRPGR